MNSPETEADVRCASAGDGPAAGRSGNAAARETEILDERVKSVFLQLPATVLVTAVNASLMTAVLVGAEHDHRAYGWLAAILLTATLRLAAWRSYRREAPGLRDSRRWARVSACGALASGLLWGGGAVVLLPQAETYQLFWVFLIGGMCAGAAAQHAAHLPTALAYILPAALPLAVRLALDGSARGAASAAMILVFLAALTATGRRSSLRFGELLRLQFALAQRTGDLDATNDRLRREIAEHRTTEATLRQAQKMEAMGQLTGGIAHDFNNLLTAVLGSLELLRARVPAADARAARLLDNAVQAAQRGAALTQRLLAFGRRQALTPEPVDVPALVRAMSDLLRSSVGNGVQIETRFPIVVARAHVDANQLELALLNLVVNARDAMPEGGRLTIAAREEEVSQGGRGRLSLGSYVLLSVTDTGEGMDEATLAQATEPFFTTKAVGKGTGLGLSMVYGLAIQSGGQLVLHSRRGEGTTVELWLPRAEAAAMLPLAAPEPARAEPDHRRPDHRRPDRRRLVLLVDDDPLVLTSVAAMLDDLGHTAVEAGSGRQALEILRGGSEVDLVITDYSMPEMTGLQLAEELGRLRPGLAVLLATGHIEAMGPLPSGAIALAKPFGSNALARAIEACFDREPATAARIFPFVPR